MVHRQSLTNCSGRMTDWELVMNQWDSRAEMKEKAQQLRFCSNGGKQSDTDKIF